MSDSPDRKSDQRGVRGLFVGLSLDTILREELAGYPQARSALMGWSNRDLVRERREMLKGSFDPMFGMNAKKVLSLIEGEIAERKGRCAVTDPQTSKTVTIPEPVWDEAQKRFDWRKANDSTQESVLRNLQYAFVEGWRFAQSPDETPADPMTHRETKIQEETPFQASASSSPSEEQIDALVEAIGEIARVADSIAPPHTLTTEGRRLIRQWLADCSAVETRDGECEPTP